MTAPQLKSENRCAGFTLVEMLAATVLMAIVLAAVATITAQWLPNWNRNVTRLQSNEQISLGLDRLTADIAAAEFISPGRGTLQPLFVGTNRSVEFVRTALGPNARIGLEIVRISDARGDRGPVTVRTRASFKPVGERGGFQPGQTQFTDPVVLLRSPYTIAFEYAGSDRIWRDTWSEQPLLPRAVKLTVHDIAMKRPLAISTAQLVHSELPVDCITSKSLADCLTALLQPRKSAQENGSRS
jgi:general secretion pathway protein J